MSKILFFFVFYFSGRSVRHFCKWAVNPLGYPRKTLGYPRVMGNLRGLGNLSGLGNLRVVYEHDILVYPRSLNTFIKWKKNVFNIPTNIETLGCSPVFNHLSPPLHLGVHLSSQVSTCPPLLQISHHVHPLTWMCGNLSPPYCPV